MRQLLRRVWYLLRRRRFDADLREELATHQTMKQAELERAGFDSQAASFAARRALGGVALAQDQSRDVWTPRWLQGLGQDVRLSGRALRKTPIVAATAILSLAFGIGANTAIFSITDSLLLRALPVRDPQRLVTLSTPRASDLHSVAGWSYSVWQQLHDHTELFDGAIAWGTQRVNLARGGETQLIDGLWVSGTFFDVLGVEPAAGRLVTEDDDRRGGGPNGPVAVLSYGFSQQRFGSAAGAIGQSLTVEGVPFIVVGVTTPGFMGTEVGRTFDIAVPIGDEPLVRRESRLNQQRLSWLSMMARLKPKDSLETADARLRAVQPAIRAATLPDNFPMGPTDIHLSGREGFVLVPAATGNSRLRTQYTRPLFTIQIVVGLVLLIACANIANLQLARTLGRRHELSLQVALGAPRWRLVRLLYTESMMLAMAGAAAGLVVSRPLGRLIVRQLSTSTNTVALDVTIDVPVLLFTLAALIATAIFFGTVPAWRMSRAEPMVALTGHGRSPAGETGAHVSDGLVIAQVALSVTLVVAVGLFVRTFTALVARNLGFNPARILLVSVDAQHVALTPPQRLALDTEVARVVRALPGVADAALSNVTPLQGGGMVANIAVSGGLDVPPTLLGGIANTMGNAVSPEWFHTLGVPLVSGRGLMASDTAANPHVVVVNEAFVRRFLNDSSPLGRTMTSRPMPPGATPWEIVGVVGDAVYGSPRESPLPTYYTALAQGPPAPPTISLEVRSATDAPSTLTHAISHAVAAVNPDLALTFRPLTDQVKATVTQERLVALLATLFGALAVVLAGLGLYGVTAYAVARRKRELGVRMALGAAPTEVVRLVLSRVTSLVGLGALAGAGLSVWASRFVATLLYSVEPQDPATLIGAVLVLATVAVAAAGIPSWRASRIDPALVLRNE